MAGAFLDAGKLGRPAGGRVRAPEAVHRRPERTFPSGALGRREAACLRSLLRVCDGQLPSGQRFPPFVSPASV